MAGRSRFFIVDPLLIMSRDQIEAEMWKTVELANEFNNKEQSILWCARRKLINNNLLCAACDVPSSFIRYSCGIDGFRWSCRICGSKKSIREGSIFSGSHLTLYQIVHIIYLWTRDQLQKEISYQVGMAARSMVDWANFLREECTKFNGRDAVIGGVDSNGDPKIVEIDESYYFHKKYDRGRWLDGCWVFGGIERDQDKQGKCFMVSVEDRCTETLQEEILKHILPGSHIISDGWAAYANISNIWGGIYTHAFVIHERNFVDPADRDTHTQHIENMWMRSKARLRIQFGTTRGLFESYLEEFVFRNTFRKHDNLFGVFLNVIGENYSIGS